MHSDNNWYGNKKILLDYCNLESQPVYASLYHGWIFSEHLKTRNKKKITPGNLLTWNNKQLKIVQEKNKKNTFSIGSPFLYLDKFKKKILRKRKICHGVLCFPPHSKTNYHQEFNHKNFIKFIESNFNPPYSCCLYYVDFNSEIKEFYKKSNWNILTAGARDDLYHIEKIYDYLDAHDKIVVPYVCTQFFYSLYLKKDTFIVNKSYDNNESFFSNNAVTEYQSAVNNYFQFKYPEFFTNQMIPKKIGFHVACEELGYDCIKESNELKKLLGLDSFFKKFLAKMINFIFDIYNGRKLRKGIDLRKH
jgi:hypothetical protein